MDTKDNVFGLKDASAVNMTNLELRYEVETGKDGNADHLRQRVYRDKDGNYFMAISGGTNASFGFETRYQLHGREVMVPISPVALAVWAKTNLCGQEYEQALKEFKYAPESLQHKTIWLYQQGNVHEFLWKTTDNLYMLFSTDASYPCPGSNIPFIEFKEDDADVGRDDLYLYYVVRETACRWAKARGMDENACQKAFGCVATR